MQVSQIKTVYQQTIIQLITSYPAFCFPLFPVWLTDKTSRWVEGKHFVNKFADDEMEFFMLKKQHIAYLVKLQIFEYQFYIKVAKLESRTINHGMPKVLCLSVVVNPNVTRFPTK
jgi:hypothetical protein